MPSLRPGRGLLRCLSSPCPRHVDSRRGRPGALVFFYLACFGIVCFHATANVLNDYFDTRYQRGPDGFSHGALPPAARFCRRMFTPGGLLLEGAVLATATAAIGLALALRALHNVSGSAWPACSPASFIRQDQSGSSTGRWGELAYFSCGDRFMFEGAYVVQRQILSLKTLVVSVPFGVLVALVLFANNIRDITYDSRRPILTFGILLGPLRSLHSTRR